jgi:hypothetical protein
LAKPEQAGQFGGQQVGVLMPCGNAQEHHAIAIIGQPEGSMGGCHAAVGRQQQGIAPRVFAHAGWPLRTRDANPRAGRLGLQGLQRQRLAAELGQAGFAETLCNGVGRAEPQGRCAAPGMHGGGRACRVGWGERSNNAHRGLLAAFSRARPAPHVC